MDLAPYIDLAASEILNAKGTLGDVFVTSNNEDASSSAPAGVVSECDPQLLITVHFKEPVKLTSIKFVCAESSSAPQKVKLFVNKLNLGFSEVEEQAATQELKLNAKDVSASTVSAESATKLLTAKFAKVSSLTIFVADNQGDEEATNVARIVLYGASQSGAPPTNVKTINSPLEYNSIVKNSPGKTVIAYFHAPWCSHCRKTGPLVAKASMVASDLVVMSIDVDKLGKTLPEAGKLQGVPHFMVYQEGKLVYDEAGIPQVLQNMMQKFEFDVHDSMPAPARDPSMN